MSARHFGCPVLKRPSPEYRTAVQRFGSCSAVHVSKDGKTVVKSALTFDCDGLDEAIVKQYAWKPKDSLILLEREQQIYKMLGAHEGILEWQITDLGLILPYLPRGDLRHVLLTEPTTREQRAAWIQSAVQTLVYIHSRGVLVSDISTRNILVRDDDTVVVCDFAGSQLGSLTPDVRPETRYMKMQESGHIKISMQTEVFAIGSLIYEIATAARPYDKLPDDEVAQLFRDQKFPSLDVPYRSIIDQCWNGRFVDSTQVLQAIESYHECGTETIRGGCNLRALDSV